MALVHSRARSVLSAAALIAGMVWVTAACGGETSPEPAEGTSPKGTTTQSNATWNEPASYVYTLTSNEQALAGSFRVTVRDGKVTKAVGLDDSSREVVERGPGQIPKIGDLLDRLEKARHEQADTADVEYAADGHPLRIILDWDENSIDDEAKYVISSYEPAGS
ncbi:hypothetical protein EJ357_06975 [Streptomyces cyaneochromogenes]|uniref:Lipoprotein n=1 Tax=Streptomyces cyaneochromogenes TaxID=2496836 RepID=A0A3Q9ELN2_9ACTN|nr:DUF6174 domain-containing protein [Streptomyces cyaneochromogenes]AZQ33224.1 hypothetical protein EJ357_06975 [Streptomyces cyaneochromogenes]